MKKQALTFLAVFGVLAVHASINFSGTLRLFPQWTNVKTEGASVVTENFVEIISSSHTTGTNANQMTSLARASGTLTNSAEVVLDLLGGVENSFGDALTLTRVNMLCITADATNTDPLHVGGAATTPFETWCGTNGLAVVRPGGAILFHAPDIVGYNVGTNGNLKILNTGTNTATYSVYIGGIQ